jgi:hypothetical protein
MDLPSLIAGLGLPNEIETAITDLVARKADATERDATHRIPVLDRLIGNILAEPIQPLASCSPKGFGSGRRSLRVDYPRGLLQARHSNAALRSVAGHHAPHNHQTHQSYGALN